MQETDHRASMAKPKLKAGRINRRGVGYVESTGDAHAMLELARARALSSKPKELRIVISEAIAPWDAPEIVAILKIGGYADRDVDQIFSKAVATSTFEKDLPIAVINPRVLFFKEKALKKLNECYGKAFDARRVARLRLKDIHAKLNTVEAEVRATNSKIIDLQRNIRTTLLIRAAAKSPPLQLPQGITQDELKLHYAFLIDPFLD